MKLAKLKLFCFGLIFLCLSAQAQTIEICNNGKDDDGDGLIDLNDATNCPCLLSVPLKSLISNHSFEESTICPFFPSQIRFSKGWLDLNQANPDYLNSCGFKSKAIGTKNLLPFPDGNAAAGIFILPNWQEYLATCLDTNLQAGVSYTLKFNVAFTTVNWDDSNFPSCEDGNGPFDPITFTLFGSSDCKTTRLNTTSCPTAVSNLWKPLGKVIYEPKTKWSKLSITLTPATDIRSIMLGPDCYVPPMYNMIPSNCHPYFFIDNLLLNTTLQAKKPEIIMQSLGSACAGNLVLKARLRDSIPAGSVFQWFRNGIALAGQTDTILTFTKENLQTGNYQIQLLTSSDCLLSPAFSVTDLPPLAIIRTNSDSIVVVGNAVALVDSSKASSSRIWTFCDGTEESGAKVTLVLADTGQCCVRLVALQSTCSDTAIRCFNVVPKPVIFIPNLFTPNKDGLNDAFRIEGNGLKSLECSIFNRWGQKVHHWKGIDGFWDGSTTNGELISGSYFFLIRYSDIENKEVTSQGWVDMIKD